MTENTPVDLARLDELVDIMEQNDLTELELVEQGHLVSLERPAVKRRRTTDWTPDAESESGSITVTSTRVGIFLSRAEASRMVKQGEVLAEIRVMDVKYGVVAPCDGIVEELYAEEGVAVEYGQPLMRLNSERRP